MMTLVSVAMTAITASAGRAQVLNIWPHRAPGSEAWTQQERTVENTPVGTVVYNVVTPTLTVFLPEEATATGTGIIIAPGGAFVALTMDLEGKTVAQWFQRRGIAAFLLKYRIMARRQGAASSAQVALSMDSAGQYGIADGIQALRVVRRHASEWRLDADRIGFLGFSAGAMVTSGALLQQDVAGRPSFAGLIYGAPFGTLPRIPSTLPPVFLAWAQDDAIARAPLTRFQNALIAAGHRPEVHVFSSGGHGYGLRTQGTSSDHWIDEFYFWLQAQGFTRRDVHSH